MKLDDAIPALLPKPLGAQGAGARRLEATNVLPDAWRQEMERAQVESWFPGALPTPRGVIPSAEEPPRIGEGAASTIRNSDSPSPLPGRQGNGKSLGAIVDSGTQHVAGQPSRDSSGGRNLLRSLAPGSRPVLALSAHGESAPAGSVALAATRGPESNSSPLHVSMLRPVDAVPGRAGAPLAEGSEASDAGAAVKSRGRQAASAPPEGQLPVRVHVEGDAQQATVWLGVDAGAYAELPAVTQAIARWMARSGYGAATWICNGQILDRPHTTEGEGEPQRDAPLVATRHPIKSANRGESA
jgi:hypothetical protein